MLTQKAVNEKIQGLTDEMSSLYSQVESMQSRYKGSDSSHNLLLISISRQQKDKEAAERPIQKQRFGNKN